MSLNCESLSLLCKKRIVSCTPFRGNIHDYSLPRVLTKDLFINFFNYVDNTAIVLPENCREALEFDQVDRKVLKNKSVTRRVRNIIESNTWIKDHMSILDDEVVHMIRGIYILNGDPYLSFDNRDVVYACEYCVDSMNLHNHRVMETGAKEDFKKICEGSAVNISCKFQGDQIFFKTPVLLLSNSELFVCHDAAFKDIRCKIYRWKIAAFLKDSHKKPYPLAIFKVLDFYNIKL